MKNWAVALLFVIVLAGCTRELQPYTVEGVYRTAQYGDSLDVLVTDEMQVRSTTLFSGEMTRLVLNVINFADVPFTNVKAIIINADDLEPSSDIDMYELIEANSSKTFEWDLTAPQLGLGESLYLNNIKVRTFYETFANATKTILLKAPGDRTYESTFSQNSFSPVVVKFETAYETVSTLNNSVKNFTVNLMFFNNYSGIIDYYDNTNIADNYVRRIVIGIDKNLLFYNYLDKNTPWEKINTTFDLTELKLTSADLDLKDYYLLSYKTLGSSGCLNFDDGTIAALSNTFTNQRRVLWMTRGTTKINVLRFGARAVESTTEIELVARIDYSYSQDFGGENFGVAVYGLG